MQTNPERVAEIAGRLSEAQREVLNELSYYPDRNKRGARPMDVCASQGRYAAVVLKQLCAKDLAEFYNWARPGTSERGSCRYWITPLGLAVRAHLQSTETPNAG